MKSCDPMMADKAELVWIVVDDNPGILEVISLFLETLGHRVECFQSPAKALAAFRATPEVYGNVITDLEMPGMNGIELCEELHAIAPHLKVLLITGNGAALDSAGARYLGFSGLLYKPFDFDDLGQLLHGTGCLAADFTPAGFTSSRA
ncbi:MAG TPA: response regulator [Candidatus Paceibacterota bacterium]|nr:response regulator [Candidatus Paceibacterota bacterium]